MQTYIKIIKFIIFFNFEIIFYIIMFRMIWSPPGALEVSALPSLNTIPKYTLDYVFMCCCTFVVLDDFILCKVE
jgi:hypothetical protein